MIDSKIQGGWENITNYLKNIIFNFGYTKGQSVNSNLSNLS